MVRTQYISISSALKRLRSSDFHLFGAASRRIAWDSIMASGSKKQLREANDARDLFAFPTTPAPGEAITE
ncbi:MAG: hypothetical protein ACHQNE_00215 [Candidatus Kapaibacterium sp.]